MRNIFFLFMLLFGIQYGCVEKPEKKSFTKEDYTKQEVYIEMRDGVKLFTVIYQPKDNSNSYPVLINRTPYGCKPYGQDTLPKKIVHNEDLLAAGYIFIYQDMRGRWMSEGKFENTKPPYSFVNPQKTDEVTDSWDTFEWFTKNLKNFNGNIGIYGNSYRGFTALIGATAQHPALKASMPMAPVTDFFFEDFYRYGIFSSAYIPVMDVFGIQKTKQENKYWYDIMDKPYVLNKSPLETVDYYDYFLKNIALSSFDSLLQNNFFWKEFKAHPTYDDFRQKRNWLNYLDRVKCPTMIVGGWNDEQNLYGILNAYKTINKKAEQPYAQLVLGPWTHGENKKRDSLYYMADHYYGKDISKDFQQQIELPFWEYHLKGKGEKPNFRKKMFDMGKKQWFEPKELKTKPTTFYFAPENKLSEDVNQKTDFKFVSDPDSPVPATAENKFSFMPPKSYMNGDQRFATKRNDVLTFSTPPLEADVTVFGEPKVVLEFSTDQEDADLFVKIIDVYPEDREPLPTDKEGVNMKGYQQTVRVGLIRARYRDNYSEPTKLEAGKKTKINVPMLDVFHTFKKGHRIMIQVQSSMFPLYEMNPQKYVENVFLAKNEDFEKANHTIFRDSYVTLPVQIQE